MEVKDYRKDIEKYQPMIDDLVHSLWFIGFPGGDWMATLWEHDGKARFSARLRTHVDDRVFDSADEKEWKFGMGEPSDIPAMTKALDGMMDHLKMIMPLHDGGERIDINGNVEKMIEKIRDKPWCNIKTLGND